MQRHRILGDVETVAVVVIWLQAVRALFSVLFGVIYDALFVGPFSLSAVAIILLTFLAFLSPLAMPRGARNRHWWGLGMAVVIFLARIPLTLDWPTLRLASSLAIVAAGGIYLGRFLTHHPRSGSSRVVMGLAAEQLLRAAGHTYDPTMRAEWLIPQAIVSLALAGMATWRYRRSPANLPGPETRITAAEGLAMGAFLFLETSLLALPNGVARWAGVDYTVAAPLVLLATLLPLLPGVQAPTSAREGIEASVWQVSRMVTILAALWMANGLPGGVSLAALLVAQGMAVAAFGSITSKTEGQPRWSGAWLALGQFIFLVLNFAYAFAFTYAYTFAFFRGAGLPILMAAGVLAAWPRVQEQWRTRGKTRRTEAMAWAGVLVATVLCLMLTLPPRLELQEAPSTLRMATYNIHYGYNSHWNFTLEAQAQAIEESEADIVALQEVDAGRITSLSVDDALWLGRRLRMAAHYQPTVEHLTGIALLSRVPLQAVEGKLLTSQAEQTALVGGEARLAEGRAGAYGIWLGLTPEERLVQLGEALDLIEAREGPALLGGDFNAPPGSPVYALMQEHRFVDPFAALGAPPSPTSPAEGPEERIDYVWVRGLQPLRAWVSDSLASDHRMVVVEVASGSGASR